jgi:hypothetical protein
MQNPIPDAPSADLAETFALARTMAAQYPDQMEAINAAIRHAILTGSLSMTEKTSAALAGAPSPLFDLLATSMEQQIAPIRAKLDAILVGKPI